MSITNRVVFAKPEVVNNAKNKVLLKKFKVFLTFKEILTNFLTSFMNFEVNPYEFEWHLLTELYFVN